MKVVLTVKDMLPLIQKLLEERYSNKKVRVQFVMKRKSFFSSNAEMTIECEIED